MIYSVLSAYILTVFLFLIIPGPVNLAVVEAAAKRGFKGALCAVAGTNAASLCLIATAGLMMAGVGKLNPRLLDYLALAGSLYLLYYGVSLWRNRRPHQQTHAKIPKSHSKIFIGAFAVGISNPKDVIFFMTFFPPFIGQLGMDLLPALLVLTALWCVLDYAILLAYGLGIAKIITPQREHIIQILCAVLFIGFGAYALFRTVNTLLV